MPQGGFTPLEWGQRAWAIYAVLSESGPAHKSTVFKVVGGWYATCDEALAYLVDIGLVGAKRRMYGTRVLYDVVRRDESRAAVVGAVAKCRIADGH